MTSRSPALLLLAAVLTFLPACRPGQDAAQTTPQRDASGAYPMLVASLQRGDITEFKLSDVSRWGAPVASTVNSRPAWTIPVQCQTSTKFGSFTVETTAEVTPDGKVTWRYAGSGEPVP
jgi:hypothetical protein